MSLDTKLEQALLAQVTTLCDRAKTVLQTINSNASRNWSYYNGELPATITNGGSQAIEFVVKENVDAVVRELGSIFCSLKREAVSYIPKHEMDVEGAKLSTKAVNAALLQHNPGDLILKSAFKESAMSGNGFVTAFIENIYEKGDDVVYEDLTQEEVDEAQFQLEQMPLPRGYQDFIVKSRPKRRKKGVETYSGHFEITYRKTLPKVELIPTENAFYEQGVGNLQDQNYFAYRTVKTVGDLIEMGYSLEDVRGAEDFSFTDLSSDIVYSRKPEYLLTQDGDSFSNDDLGRKVYVYNEFVRTSIPSEGKKLELFQVIRTGEVILSIEPIDYIPIVNFRLEPIVNTFEGAAIANLLTRKQDLATASLRGITDGAMNRAYGRYTAVKNQYDRKALLHNTPGGVVEQNEPGMISPFPYQPMNQELQLVRQMALETASNLSIGREMGDNSIQANTAPTTASILYAQSKLKGKDFANNIVQSYKELTNLLYRMIREEGIDFQVVIDGELKTVSTADWPKREELQEEVLVDSDKMRQKVAMDQMFEMTARMASINPELAATLMSEKNVYSFLKDYAELNDIYVAGTTYYTKPEDMTPAQVQVARQKQQEQDHLQDVMLQTNLEKLELEVQKLESEVEAAAQDIVQKKAEFELKKQELDVKVKSEATKAAQAEADHTLKEKELDLKEEELETEALLTQQEGKQVNIGTNV